jgi:hypothetical protein
MPPTRLRKRVPHKTSPASGRNALATPVDNRCTTGNSNACQKPENRLKPTPSKSKKRHSQVAPSGRKSLASSTRKFTLDLLQFSKQGEDEEATGFQGAPSSRDCRRGDESMPKRPWNPCPHRRGMSNYKDGPWIRLQKTV